MIALALARSDLPDESSYVELRATVPRDRGARADRYLRPQDRHSSVVAFSLLQHLWDAYGQGPLPAITLAPSGKPQFASGHSWHFNWSHDAGVCACALSRIPLGVDVQARVPYDASFFARIATADERVWQADLATADDLGPLWTRKEALIKLSGRGLSAPLRELDTRGPVITYYCAALGVWLSVAAGSLNADELAQGIRFHHLDRAKQPGVWRECARPVPTRWGGPR